MPFFNRIRQFLRGDLDTSGMSKVVLGQLETIRRRHWRKMMRRNQREDRARQHRHSALLGGGKRECARRRRQIAEGRLTRSSGLEV